MHNRIGHRFQRRLDIPAWLERAGGQTLKEKILALYPANLVAYWVQDELSGAVAVDSSPRGNDGANTAVALGQPGIGDGRTSYGYDGATSFVNIHSAGLEADLDRDECSIVAWGQNNDWTGTGAYLLHLADATNADRITLGAATPGADSLTWRYDVGAVEKSTTRGSTTTNEFFMMGLTISLLADEVIAYYNGLQEGPIQNGVPAWGSALGATRCCIGARLTAAVNVWNGRAAHVAIWSGAILSGSEMASIG